MSAAATAQAIPEATAGPSPQAQQAQQDEQQGEQQGEQQDEQQGEQQDKQQDEQQGEQQDEQQYPAGGGQFAMKVLKKRFIVDEGNVTRALAEREIMSLMYHPFIVRLHWTFQSPQHLFLVMTYVGGGELYELMERHLSLNGKPMPVPWARFYAAELALALEHLHSHGILYRDLKPENVLLGLDGHVCLTDFGLAMAVDEEEGAGEIAGTPYYISPDSLGEEPPDEGVDWWSFGIILYEMLFGAVPFGAGIENDVDAIFRAISAEPLRFPRLASSRQKSVVNKLLARDRAKRMCAAPRGFAQLETHPFFAQIDFGKLLHRQLPPPYLPPRKSGEAAGRCTFLQERRRTSVMDEGDIVGEAMAKDLSRRFSAVGTNESAVAAAKAAAPGGLDTQ